MKTEELIKKFEKQLRLADRYGKKFAKDPQKVLREGLLHTAEIAEHFARLLKLRDYSKLDDFFFSREKLPLGGKEYWFFTLVSTKGDRTQLVLTFGSSDLPSRVNRQTVAGDRVATVGWLFSRKMKVFLEKTVSLECRKGLLRAEGFALRGAHPSYELEIGSNTRIRFTKPKIGPSYEAQEKYAGTIGVGMLNLYLDAKGVLDGKDFTGIGYLQKVVVVAPFLPWNWVRLVFPDSSVLDFFVARLDMRAVGYELHTKATYRQPSGRTANLKDGKLTRLPNGRWLLAGKGFEAYMKTYAFKPFVLSGRGEFHYDEYMVECTDFTFGKARGKAGIGIVEDAYGFMI